MPTTESVDNLESNDGIDGQVDDKSAPASDPLLEPAVEFEPPVVNEPAKKINPLQPGGVRFEQVYAQSKQAQRERDAERDRRIAAEAQLELLKQGTTRQTPNQEPEYEWTQLEAFIASGQITRAEAQEHREKVIAKRLKNEMRTDFQRETTTATREQTLLKSIAGYVQVVPAITDKTSEDRQKVDAEFDWLVNVQGVDVNKLQPAERKALELTALRNVYGPLDKLVKRTESTVTETHQGLPGGTPPVRSKNPDQALLDNLTKPQVEHYNKMMRAGRYKGGWAEVVAELKFQAPASQRR